MRTTITIDPDVYLLIRKTIENRQISFKQLINQVLRESLSASEQSQEQEPFVVHARPMGLRPGIDKRGFNKMYDDLEADDFSSVAEKQGKGYDNT